jgi:hypothetical protein
MRALKIVIEIFGGHGGCRFYAASGRLQALPTLGAGIINYGRR